MRERNPKGEVVTIANGSDFDDFAGHRAHAERDVPDHARGIVLRQARPAAVPDRAAAVGARRRRRALPRRLPLDRPRVGRGAGARRAARADPVRAAPHARSSCSATPRSLLLLIPEAGGRGKGVLSGKVFEYLAAERPILALVPPDGAAAELIRDVGRRRGRRPRGRRRDRGRAARPARALARRVAAGERALRGVAGEGLAPLARRRPRAAAGAHSRETARRASSSSRASSASRSRRCTGTSPAPSSLADVLAILFLVAFAISTRRWRVPRTTAILLGFFACFLLVYLAGYFDLSDSDAFAQWAKGLTKWLIHFAFLAAAVVWLSRRGQRVLLAHARLVQRRDRRQRDLRRAPAARRAAGRQPRCVACSRRSPAAPARSTSTARSTARASTGRTR